MNFCQNKTDKLVIQNIRKSYEETRVIDDVSLTVGKNEFVSLMGLSGSGKSTIFNIISGLVLPDMGEVIIDGEIYTGRTGRVSYMYQKDLLLPWKKIIDNVCIPLIIKGQSKKDARETVADYFKVFGLEGFENKYPFQLSGGMKQRAALMRTYMFSRDIMLLDEPFAGLDAITRMKMHHWLLKVLKDLRASVLLITHDVEEAVFLSDRIYILSERPATVRGEVTVNLPEKRDAGLVTTSEFNEIKKKVLNMLQKGD